MKNCGGFLLIELLVALAILSLSLLVITVQLTNTIHWQQEARLRMRALNVAISSLEKMTNGKKFFAARKEIDGFSVAIANACVHIDQEKIDAVIPTTIKKKVEDFENLPEQKKFQPISVTVKWKGASGKEKKLQLLTGALLI